MIAAGKSSIAGRRWSTASPVSASVAIASVPMLTTRSIVSAASRALSGAACPPVSAASSAVWPSSVWIASA